MKKIFISTIFILFIIISLNDNVFASEINSDFDSIFGNVKPVSGDDISVTFRNYTSGTIRTATLHGSSSINFYPVLASIDDGIQALYFIGITSSDNPTISLKYDNGHSNQVINSIDELSANNPIINNNLDISVWKLNDISINGNTYHIYSFIPCADNNIMPYGDDTLIYTDLDAFIFTQFRSYDVYTAVQDVNAINDLVQILLQGKYGSFTVGSDGKMNEVSKILYDLEVPIDIKCETKSNIDWSMWSALLSLLDPKSLTVKMSWKQSDDININGWNLDIIGKSSGQYGKYSWSLRTSPHDFTTDYTDVDSVPTYMFSYKKDCYKIFKKNLDEWLKQNVSYKPDAVEMQKITLLVRNSYYEESTGIQHYSNYVRLVGDKSGKFTATEIDGASLDNSVKNDNLGYTDNKIEGSVNTNSDYYVNSIVTDDNTSWNSSVGVLRGAFSDLKDFPSFFAECFNFLPPAVPLLIGSSFVLMITLSLLLLVFNRG